MAGRRDRSGRVQQDRTASPTAGAVQDLPNRLRILVGRAAAQLLDAAARQAQLALRIELVLVNGAVDDLGDEIRADR